MIELITKCSECNHRYVCKYENEVANSCDKLKNTYYNKMGTDEYTWAMVSSRKNFNISFKCNYFEPEKGVLR